MEERQMIKRILVGLGGTPYTPVAIKRAVGLAKRYEGRLPQESIFAHGLGTYIIWVGLLMGGISVFTQAWSIRGADAHWQTMVFTVLCLSQMGNALAIRSEKESLFNIGLFSNKPLLGAVLLTFALQMATIYVPFLQPIFKTGPLLFRWQRYTSLSFSLYSRPRPLHLMN
jgi:Ca2+-transporting ATPase